MVPVQGQAEQVRGVLGGAVGLGAGGVLEVLQAEGRAQSVAGRGPHHLRGTLRLAQQGLQLPDLAHMHARTHTHTRTIKSGQHLAIQKKKINIID